MTDVNSIIFFIQLLAVMSLFFVKFYNLISVAQFYSLKIAFISLIGFLLAYGIGFVVSVLNYDDVLYSLLMQLETWLLILFIGLFIAELFLYLANSSGGSVKAYNSREAYAAKR